MADAGIEAGVMIGIAIGVIMSSLIWGLALNKRQLDLKSEAVNRSFAQWTVDNKGNSTWDWRSVEVTMNPTNGLHSWQEVKR